MVTKRNLKTKRLDAVWRRKNSSRQKCINYCINNIITRNGARVSDERTEHARDDDYSVLGSVAATDGVGTGATATARRRRATSCCYTRTHACSPRTMRIILLIERWPRSAMTTSASTVLDNGVAAAA